MPPPALPSVSPKTLTGAGCVPLFRSATRRYPARGPLRMYAAWSGRAAIFCRSWLGWNWRLAEPKEEFKRKVRQVFKFDDALLGGHALIDPWVSRGGVLSGCAGPRRGIPND
jgi:hypothetical protein